LRNGRYAGLGQNRVANGCPEINNLGVIGTGMELPVNETLVHQSSFMDITDRLLTMWVVAEVFVLKVFVALTAWSECSQSLYHADIQHIPRLKPGWIVSFSLTSCSRGDDNKEGRVVVRSS
jgi:hypothetical protein